MFFFFFIFVVVFYNNFIAAFIYVLLPIASKFLDIFVFSFVFLLNKYVFMRHLLFVSFALFSFLIVLWFSSDELEYALKLNSFFDSHCNLKFKHNLQNINNSCNKKYSFPSHNYIVFFFFASWRYIDCLKYMENVLLAKFIFIL